MKRKDSSGTEEYYLIMYFKDTLVNHLLQKIFASSPGHICMTTDAAINLILLHHLL